jgi:3-oxoacyl-[acyl-carrier protein] reductase
MSPSGSARSVDAVAVRADLRDLGAAGQLMDTAGQRWGRIHVVVANAGVPNPGVDVMHGSDVDFEQVLAVNARAVYSVLRAAASRLADGGRLINIGSSSTLYPAPERALYAASKAGPLVLTTALAAALAPRGATVNSVIAGPVADGFLAGRDPGQLHALAAQSPFGRLGTPSSTCSPMRPSSPAPHSPPTAASQSADIPPGQGGYERPAHATVHHPSRGRA